MPRSPSPPSPASEEATAATIKSPPIARRIVWLYVISLGTLHLLALLALVPYFFSWTGVILMGLGVHIFGQGFSEWKAAGEGQADNTENQFYRSVQVIFLRTPQPGPQPPQRPVPLPPPRRPRTTKHFALRVLGELQVAKFVSYDKLRRLRDLLKMKDTIGADILYVQIRQHPPDEPLDAFYIYGGLSYGIGVLSVAGTLAGPWNYFLTSFPQDVDQFEGRAFWRSAGALWWTWNWFNLMMGSSNLFIPVDTGFTWGAGADASLGWMFLIDVAKPS